MIKYVLPNFSVLFYIDVCEMKYRRFNEGKKKITIAEIKLY